MSILVTKSYGKLTPGIHHNVKRGFKKFLIAEGYGLVCSDENIEMYKNNQAKYEKENQELNENKTHLCQLLDNKFINIISSVNPTGNLYASITPQKIVDSLKEQLVKEEKYQEILIAKYIIIPQKIIQQGIFSITLKFTKDHNCKFNVIVGQNDLVIKEMYSNHINEDKNTKNQLPINNRGKSSHKPSLEIHKVENHKDKETLASNNDINNDILKEDNDMETAL